MTSPISLLSNWHGYAQSRRITNICSLFLLWKLRHFLSDFRSLDIAVVAVSGRRISGMHGLKHIFNDCKMQLSGGRMVVVSQNGLELEIQVKSARTQMVNMWQQSQSFGQSRMIGFPLVLRKFLRYILLLHTCRWPELLFRCTRRERDLYPRKAAQTFPTVQWILTGCSD